MQPRAPRLRQDRVYGKSQCCARKYLSFDRKQRVSSKLRETKIDEAYRFQKKKERAKEENAKGRKKEFEAVTRSTCKPVTTATNVGCF